jgi:beta-glucosidase-like glycosyl hydrolase
MGYDSVLSPRALREIYLMPFMLAQKYAQPWSIMTAYAEKTFHETLVMTNKQSDTTVSMVLTRQKMLIFCMTSSEGNGNLTD